MGDLELSIALVWFVSSGSSIQGEVSVTAGEEQRHGEEPAAVSDQPTTAELPSISLMIGSQAKEEQEVAVQEKQEKQQEEEVLGEAEEEEEDGWYPNNMEELLTVDEVGEDDSITEPDLPQLEQQLEQRVEQQVEQLAAAPPPGLEVQEEEQQVEQTCEELTDDSSKTPQAEGAAAAAASTNHVHEKLQGAEPPAAPPAPPGEELKKLKELKLEDGGEEEQVKTREEESAQDRHPMVVDRSNDQREELEVEQVAGAARAPHKESSGSLKKGWTSSHHQENLHLHPEGPSTGAMVQRAKSSGPL